MAATPVLGGLLALQATAAAGQQQLHNMQVANTAVLLAQHLQSAATATATAVDLASHGMLAGQLPAGADIPQLLLPANQQGQHSQHQQQQELQPGVFKRCFR